MADMGMRSMPLLGGSAWGHAPPGNFCKQSSVRLFLVASETTVSELEQEEYCYEIVQ